MDVASSEVHAAKVKTLPTKKDRVRRRAKRRFYKDINRYLVRIVKQLDGNKRIDANLARVLSSFVFDNLQKQLYECITMEKKLGKRMIRPKTPRSAVKLMYKPELAVHMNNEAAKSTETYARRTVKKVSQVAAAAAAH